MTDEIKLTCDKLMETHQLYVKKQNSIKRKNALPKEELDEKGYLMGGVKRAAAEMVDTAAKDIIKQPEAPASCQKELPNHPVSHACKTKTDVIVGGVLGLVFYLSLIFIIPGLALWFCLVPVVVALILWMAVGRKRAQIVDYDKRWAEYEKQIDKWEKEISDELADYDDEKFFKDWDEYDHSFIDFCYMMEQSMRVLEQKYYEKFDEITENYIKEEKELEETISACEKRLEEINIISSRYYYLALQIHDVLYHGRAANLMDAINIALDDERKDRDEEARRAAEARQEQILRDQAQETRMHQQRMEQNAREMAADARAHNSAMEQNADKMMWETMRHNREMEHAMRR